MRLFSGFSQRGLDSVETERVKIALMIVEPTHLTRSSHNLIDEGYMYESFNINYFFRRRY